VGRSAPGVHQQPRVAGLIEYARQQGQPWWDFDTQVGYIFKELGSSSLMVNGQSGAVRFRRGSFILSSAPNGVLGSASFH
jgi:hypothetical protein